MIRHFFFLVRHIRKIGREAEGIGEIWGRSWKLRDKIFSPKSDRTPFSIFRAKSSSHNFIYAIKGSSSAI